MIHWGAVIPELLDPVFRTDVTELLESSPYDWYVTEGFRSRKRSAALYAAYKAYKESKGPPAPRAAPAGRSAHNYGLAIDVSLDGNSEQAGCQPTWSTKAAGWLWLKAHCQTHPRLKSGWSFQDWPHIERYEWYKHIPK